MTRAVALDAVQICAEGIAHVNNARTGVVVGRWIIGPQSRREEVWNVWVVTVYKISDDSLQLAVLTVGRIDVDQTTLWWSCED